MASTRSRSKGAKGRSGSKGSKGRSGSKGSKGRSRGSKGSKGSKAAKRRHQFYSPSLFRITSKTGKRLLKNVVVRPGLSPNIAAGPTGKEHRRKRRNLRARSGSVARGFLTGFLRQSPSQKEQCFKTMSQFRVKQGRRVAPLAGTSRRSKESTVQARLKHAAQARGLWSDSEKGPITRVYSRDYSKHKDAARAVRLRTRSTKADVRKAARAAKAAVKATKKAESVAKKAVVVAKKAGAPAVAASLGAAAAKAHQAHKAVQPVALRLSARLRAKGGK